MYCNGRVFSSESVSPVIKRLSTNAIPMKIKLNLSFRKARINPNKRSRRNEETPDSQPTTSISREEILEFSSSYQTREQLSEEEAIERLIVRIRQSNNSIKLKPNRKLYLYSISTAASILLLVMFAWIYQQEKRTTLSATAGQQLTVILPDSSQVILNASTTISFSKSRWKTHRLVELNGEAFFKVKKGSQFDVTSMQGITTVLGTSFNVLARENRYQVSCYTGKVRVKLKKANAMQLITPGYETFSDDGNTLTQPTLFKKKERSGWKRGVFYFKNEMLTNVLQEMERQFDIVVDTNALEINNRYFTGCFFKGNLEESAKLVCIPMHLTYSIVGNKLIIRKK